MLPDTTQKNQIERMMGLRVRQVWQAVVKPGDADRPMELPPSLAQFAHGLDRKNLVTPIGEPSRVPSCSGTNIRYPRGALRKEIVDVSVGSAS